MESDVKKGKNYLSISYNLMRNNTPYTGPTEVEIEYAILGWLNANGCFSWKVNVKGFFDTNKGFFRKSNHVYDIRGQSDILGILPDGKLLAIEVKTEKEAKFITKNMEKLKTLVGITANKKNCHYHEQIDFLDQIKQHNGISCIACCLDDVLRVLQSNGYIF